MPLLPQDPTDARGDDLAALLVFSRAPAREDKRLGLGAERDRLLLGRLVERTFATVARARAGAPLFVAADGPAPSSLLGSATCFSQEGRGFEQRFLRALRTVSDAGRARVVVIGTDTPGLSEADLARALSSTRGEVVLGPASDGGFYLLAIDAADLDALEGLPWGSHTLARALTARLEARGRRIVRLAIRGDVDDAWDVARLGAELGLLAADLLGRAADRPLDDEHFAPGDPREALRPPPTGPPSLAA